MVCVHYFPRDESFWLKYLVHFCSFFYGIILGYNWRTHTSVQYRPPCCLASFIDEMCSFGLPQKCSFFWQVGKQQPSSDVHRDGSKVIGMQLNDRRGKCNVCCF